MPDDAVVIVGAGLAGAASAWALAARGTPVVVLEQYPPGHTRGSSHGSARIVRRAYGDALYVDLTGAAFELWRELEAAAGRSLLRMVGGVDFGLRRNVPAVAALLAAAGVRHEVLPDTEAERRWPGMRFSGPVLFHAQAGTLDAEAAVSALLEEAGTHGADVRFESAATSLHIDGTDAIVTCAGGEALRARCVVVAAGGWVQPLLTGVPVSLPPLRVRQQPVFHFPRRDVAAPAWPTVIHEDAQAFYHLPGGRDGGTGDDRKLGEHDWGTLTTAADRDGVVPAEARERAVDYVRRWLPGLDPEPSSETTCLYTLTPSEDFVIDRVGPVVVCSPCSGHGAKFAPVVGRLVAGLVDGTGPAVPDRFRLSSHALGRPGSVSL